MSPLLLPMTLATAGALGLIGLILALRVTMGRAKHRVNMGDGGNPDMIVRMRTHANFVEYVPLMLVLLGLLELGGANRTALMVGAAVLVVARTSPAPSRSWWSRRGGLSTGSTRSRDRRPRTRCRHRRCSRSAVPGRVGSLARPRPPARRLRWQVRASVSSLPSPFPAPSGQLETDASPREAAAME